MSKYLAMLQALDSTKTHDTPTAQSAKSPLHTLCSAPVVDFEEIFLPISANDTTPTEPDSKPPLYLLFASKGFDDATAKALLDAVAARGARFADDRRLCAECKSWMLDRCRKRITPIGEMTPYTLHRCHSFELEVIPN